MKHLNQEWLTPLRVYLSIFSGKNVGQWEYVLRGTSCVCSESLSVWGECLSLAHINRITGRLCSGAMDPFNRRPPSDQCSHKQHEKNRQRASGLQIQWHYLAYIYLTFLRRQQNFSYGYGYISVSSYKTHYSILFYFVVILQSYTYTPITKGSRCGFSQWCHKEPSLGS